MARTLVLPVRRMGEEEFRGQGGRLLLAGNALHADLAPESAGSGGFGWLMGMLGQTYGFPVPVGGSGALTEALARRLEAQGGRIRCGQCVERIVVRGGRAVGVRTAAGDAVVARRAVLADVSVPALYGDLLDPEHLPTRLQEDLRRFQWDFATFKVDWALDGPVPWQAEQASRAGTVHLADGLDELTRFAAQIAMREVPDRPFLLFGQMTTADATRSPQGTESAWAYTHIPHEIGADAGDDGITGRWDTKDQELMADRVERQVERFAPGFRSLVRARRILAPPPSSPSTPICTAAPSTEARPRSTSSSSSARPPAPGAPRPPSPASSWPPPGPTRVAASTAHRAPTPPGPHCTATGHPVWPAPNGC